MIKKSVFEKDLIAGMHKELIKKASNNDVEHLEKAVDYLNSAIDIFEDTGMISQANAVLNILTKIASKESITSEQMIANLKHHGTVFPLNDKHKSDDQEADDISFEDEV
jgi:hypothetical protein